MDTWLGNSMPVTVPLTNILLLLETIQKYVIYIHNIYRYIQKYKTMEKSLCVSMNYFSILVYQGTVLSITCHVCIF